MNVDPLLERLRTELAGRTQPFFVGLDGRSGAGKSTLAQLVVDELGDDAVTVIEGDEFYAGGSGATWDEKSAEEKAANVMDWRRQLHVLGTLRSGGTAEWFPFDWEAEDWDSDEACLASTTNRTSARPIVMLEGAYSSRPELHAALDLTVLLDPPAEVRRAQLLAREGDEYRNEWEHRWSAAEDHYFGVIMPPARFDLVLR